MALTFSLDCFLAEVVVGDEVHRHGVESYISENIVPAAKYKLGLSATPWSRGEDDREYVLKQLYGDIIDVYSLENAIDDGTLCPYFYHPIKVRLSADESAEYALKSRDIAALENKPFLTKREQEILSNAYRVRASILASCAEKFAWLDAHLKATHPLPFTLFYLFQLSGKKIQLSGIPWPIRCGSTFVGNLLKNHLE